MAGLYLHVPFCKQACHYCNFHFSTSLKYRDEMLTAMIRELEIRKVYLGGKVLDSIYFGGGTPSILPLESLESVLEAIHIHFSVAPDAEITLEANPDDIHVPTLKAWKALGVNRLSIGIQSFWDDELSFMNRAHSGEEAIRAVDRARAAGFEDLTIDLIYGIPISDTARWVQNLEQALVFQVPHISAYCLTIEPGTAFGNWAKKGKLQEAPDEVASEQFLIAVDTLEAAGYEHYEISNYALPGRKAKHNSAYWAGVPYLGIGPAAHSFNGENRQWNLAHNMKYIKSVQSHPATAAIPDWVDTEILSAADKHNEYVMTRLRTSGGIVPEELSAAYRQNFIDAVQLFVKQGYIINTGGAYKLSRTGKLMADAISGQLFV